MKHETSEISIHEVRFYLALTPAWKSSAELATTSKISPRTGRAFALKFVRLGIVDLAEVFPSHRYRLSDKARRRNAAYIHRLEQAKEVFGDSLGAT